jgi:hypothetical protein
MNQALYTHMNNKRKKKKKKKSQALKQLFSPCGGMLMVFSFRGRFCFVFYYLSSVSLIWPRIGMSRRHSLTIKSKYFI